MKKKNRYKAFKKLQIQELFNEANIAKEAYNESKRVAKRLVWLAKSEAERDAFSAITSDRNEIYNLARQIDSHNRNVIGDKCVRNDAGELTLSDAQKMNVWVEHQKRLSNVEFDWASEFLSFVSLNLGLPPFVTLSQVSDTIKKMKCRKTAKSSGIVAEILKASGSVGLEVLAHLMQSVIAEGVLPADWRDSIIVNLYKGKGDALDRGNYRSLKLTDHVMKLVKHVLKRRIRKMVDIDEMQFGFVSGRSATDAVFIVRQLQKKYLPVKKSKVIWWAMRKLGVEEWAVRVVQSMYIGAKN